MSLPKINAPLFTMVLPSTQKEIHYRAFTVKEEKILLMAVQGEDVKSVSLGINQILKNCIITEMDIDQLPVFDIEYTFIQIRSKSVGNIIKLNVRDEDDDNLHLVEIDVDDIVVIFPEKHTNMIVLTDELKLKLKYPSYSVIDKVGKDDTQETALLRCSMDQLISADEVFDFDDYTAKEIDEFIDSLSSQNMRDIEAFFSSMPKITYDIEYVSTTGEKKTKKLEGLTSFFTL